MDNKNLLDELIKETQRRQRRRTDLSAYNEKLKEMLDLNISLPVVLDWLAKQETVTTLPALRRYVVRTFGENFYHDFLKRNGWLKTKSQQFSKKVSKKLIPDSKDTEVPETKDKITETNPATAPAPRTVEATKKSLRDLGDIDPAQFE